MSEIVNLNKFRKAKIRGGKARQAAENRVRFGQSKDEKARAKQAAERRSKDLDGKNLGDPAKKGDE